MQWLGEFHAFHKIGKQHEQGKEQIMNGFLFQTKCPKNEKRNIKTQKKNKE